MTPEEKRIIEVLADANYCSEADVVRRLLLKEAKRVGIVSANYDPIDSDILE